MSELEFVALLLAAIGPLLALARLLRLPDTLVLFGSGLAASFVPGLPPLRVEPELMLGLFLPPILYAATVQVSFHLLRFTLVSGVLFGAGLALATIAAVAVGARALLPDLPWIAAFLLGIVAAVFDTRLFHEAQGRPHVPRAVADALKTREMVSRVVVLSCFALVLDAAQGEPLSLMGGLGRFTYQLAGGALVGWALGRAMVWLRKRVEPAPVEIAFSIATPYLGALAARTLDLSVVAVVMTAALVIAAVRIDPATGAPRTSSEARVSATVFWEQVSLILSAVLFFLAGRALPEATQTLEAWPLRNLALVAAAIFAIVVAVQLAASVVTTTPQIPAEELDAAGERWRHRLVVAGVTAWASTRSVIGLVVALSIPATLAGGQPFAERDLVVAALAIVSSIVLQGLTLAAVVRAAGLADRREGDRERRSAERAVVEARANADGAATPAGNDGGDGAPDFHAKRRALLALRARNRIGDEVLREVLRELDLRQRVLEKSSLPGAGPPNP